jgi:DNA-binding response OmpR family regulator
VWGRDTDVAPRTVGAHIRRLQSITALDELDFLRTVRDAGDALDTEPGD